MSLEARLEDILRASPVVWPALEAARTLDLPDSWIVSGAIYNTVWNALTGRAPGHGIRDIDLFYVDPDLSWEAEDAVIRRAARHFAPDPPVEIRNQARVHLWYRARFGHGCPVLTSTRASLSGFAARTHAIGVRLDAAGKVEICAPYGLEPVFALRLDPNPVGLNRPTFEAKGARARTLWPEVTVRPWPAVSVIRGAAHHDWEAVLTLLHAAFAFMEGRIDPPSSLGRLDAAGLSRMAAEGLCLLAHDGAALTGCVFAEVQAGALNLTKLAVAPEHQRTGIARALIAAAEDAARARGLAALRLQTRIELTGNHRAFARLGFRRIGETAHPGFDRSTSISMERAVGL